MDLCFASVRRVEEVGLLLLFRDSLLSMAIAVERFFRSLGIIFPKEIRTPLLSIPINVIRIECSFLKRDNEYPPPPWAARAAEFNIQCFDYGR